MSANGKNLPAVCLGALGIVFGDIGTSPLYAFRECFHEHNNLALNNANILGVLSLIFWALVLIISIKYMMFVLRADNQGEGGLLALSTLCQSVTGKNKKTSRLIMWFGLFGASLLYGDGMITPAISVLSAVEGLEIATPVFKPYIIPITIGILIGLFSIQKSGTEKIGKIFGPVMLLWFGVLGILGFIKIIDNPSVFAAINPIYGVKFFLNNGFSAFMALGAVFLVVTGGEALYADMGHFGKKPIRYAWIAIPLPGLLLNYFGQGALLISNPAAINNPFYQLVPPALLYPVIILATLATVIASQAVISGVFSLTTQAIKLGYIPRFKVVQTSKEEIGQVYLPKINLLLLVATCLLVVGFKSSGNLAAAYGIAVSLDMVITTMLIAYLAAKMWKWKPWAVGAFVIFFIPIDLAFFTANSLKFFDGGWFPILIAATSFTLMVTWNAGRKLLGSIIKRKVVSFETLEKLLEEQKPPLVKGTAVYLTSSPEGTSPALLKNLKHNKVLHENNIFLNVKTLRESRVPFDKQIEINRVSDQFVRVAVNLGFIQNPNIPWMIKRVANELDFNPEDVTYFIGRETLIPSKDFGLPLAQAKLFSWMSLNSQSASSYFQLPKSQVIEIGMQVEI